ncbi:MAG: nickel pincer cofactor biosynthesis protein LarC [Bacteroidales bacterium]|jgi:uncharacterized protein (TIGR00299 family) protein|nr:nickel pincer cofactor biosynthesis protein LarC [Bacteroidales bacterium]
MNILYFDCFSGISGDMTLSAFLDLGISQKQLTDELNKLNISGWNLRVSRVVKNAISATHVDVETSDSTLGNHHHHHPHVHRTLSDITRIIDESGISANAKNIATRIFTRLAAAEAAVHATKLDSVHFHETGAIDSLIDIVGTAICMDILSPDKVCASTLHDGHGFVQCQHGTIPVPVPAVVELLAARNISLKQLDVEGEMMTPTGAAIIAELAENFGSMPEMKITKIAYGAGTREFNAPNLLRIIQGETSDKTLNHDTVTVLETNIDDTTPEILGYTLERLFEAGVRDAYFTPVYMKKCRPAFLLTVLCDEIKIQEMEHILFTETSTIGIRKYTAERSYLPRKTVTLSTPFGEINAKEIICDSGTSRFAVEYEDARRLAKEKNVPLQDIYHSISKQSVKRSNSELITFCSSP